MAAIFTIAIQISKVRILVNPDAFEETELVGGRIYPRLHPYLSQAERLASALKEAFLKTRVVLKAGVESNGSSSSTGVGTFTRNRFVTARQRRSDPS